MIRSAVASSSSVTGSGQLSKSWSTTAKDSGSVKSDYLEDGSRSGRRAMTSRSRSKRTNCRCFSLRGTLRKRPAWSRGRKFRICREKSRHCDEPSLPCARHDPVKRGSGDEARDKCDSSLKENYLKYWGILSEWNQPEDIPDEEWNDIITTRRFESTAIDKY